MKRNNILYFILLIMTLVFIGGMINHFSEKGKEVVSDTVTVVHYDTVYSTNTFTVYEPKPYKVETVKVDTVYLKDSTKIELKEETKLYKDSVCQEGDTIFQELLIQGINAKVLYAKVLLKKQFIHQNTETIITNHIEKKKKTSFSDHFFIAPAITVGYDPINKDMGMVIGISAGIKF